MIQMMEIIYYMRCRTRGHTRTAQDSGDVFEQMTHWRSCSRVIPGGFLGSAECTNRRHWNRPAAIDWRCVRGGPECHRRHRKRVNILNCSHIWSLTFKLFVVTLICGYIATKLLRLRSCICLHTFWLYFITFFSLFLFGSIWCIFSVHLLRSISLVSVSAPGIPLSRVCIISKTVANEAQRKFYFKFRNR